MDWFKSTPEYLAAPSSASSSPAPDSSARRVASVSVRVPIIDGSDTIGKGSPIVLIPPSGATRYTVAFTPADPVTSGSPACALPIGIAEDDGGTIAGEPFAVTPLWVRLGSAPVQADSMKADLMVIFD